MKPMKFLAWIMMMVLGISATLAYTVVDFDDINYIGGKSVLLTYGWRNSSTADSLSYCYAIGGELSCADPAGFGRAVHHLFNAVNYSYCLTKNTQPNGNASNITIRVSLAVINPPIPNNVEQFGISGNLASSPLATMRGYIYMNNSGQLKICLRSGTSEVCPYNQPTNTNVHDVQIDYVMQSNPSLDGTVGVVNATMWVDGNSSSLTATTTGWVSCPNSTAYYFRQGLEIYNLTVINYNQTDTFILYNQSLGFANVTYECSDTIDNDNDSFVDLLDPSCSDITDNSELPIDKVQCNDMDDNDGDGLVDLQDPQCGGNSTYIDESPFNLYQCNDGNDNDGDGFIDYGGDSINDPSCSFYNDTDEYPLDGTTQESDTCSVSNFCIMRESFPYSDSIYFHDWTDLSGYPVPDVAIHSSDYVLRFSNFDENNISRDINIYKYFNNDASLYKDILTTLTFEVERDYTFTCNATCLAQDSIFYALLETNSNSAIILKYVLHHDDLTTDLYYVNSTGEYPVTTYSALIATSLNLVLTENQTSNTVTIGSSTFPFYSGVVPTRIRFYANASQFDGRVFKLYSYLIDLKGQLSTGSICSQYEPPYYIKDDFTYEKLSDCGWQSTLNPLTQGKLVIENNLGSFQAYISAKDTLLNKKVELTNRYSTISFGFTPLLSSTSERTLNFFVYTDNFKTKLLTLGFDRNGKAYSYPNGVSTYIADLDEETENNIALVIDLTDDVYDLYVDSVLVATDVKFDDTSYNFESISGVMLSSYRSYYYFDSLLLYTSDNSGTPVITQPTIPSEIVNQTTTLFGLFFKLTPSCNSDDDCESGLCMSYGTCSNFNWKACDEAGYPRTHWCSFKLLSAGFLGWVKDLILDNFLMFIVFLILLMILVYFAIMVRRVG